MFGRKSKAEQRREAETERLANNFEDYFKAKWNGVFERPDVNQDWQVSFKNDLILAARTAIFKAGGNTGDE